MAGAHRLAKLARTLEQEEQDREVAICTLQRSQEEASQRMEHEVARMQVPGRALASGQPPGLLARGSIRKRPQHSQPMSFPLGVLPYLQLSF